MTFDPELIRNGQNDLKKRRIEQSNIDHGVDMDALKSKLDKLHSIPQLAAGVDGKLKPMAPKIDDKPLTPEEKRHLEVIGLADFVGREEGSFIYRTVKPLTGNKPWRAFKLAHEDLLRGNLAKMTTLLHEFRIEINHLPPHDGYVMPEDVLLYRRICIEQTVGEGEQEEKLIKGERVWEWKREV